MTDKVTPEPLPTVVGGGDDQKVAVAAPAPAVNAGSSGNTDGVTRSKTKQQLNRDRLVDNIIAKVKDPLTMTNWECEKDVEDRIRITLLAWDKDQTGTFSPTEVEDAMADLAESENRLAGLKWQFIAFFTFIFFFLVFLTVSLAIGFALMKSYDVPDNGQAEMRGKNAASKKPSVTEMVVTTSSRGEFSLPNLLKFDTTSDDWLIEDGALRELDYVSFRHKNDVYYNLEVAEVIRIDAGKNGTNDKLEIATTGGVRLRVWESIGDLEVLWKNATMWEGVPRNQSNQSAAGGRLLTEKEELERPAFAEEQHMLNLHESWQHARPEDDHEDYTEHVMLSDGKDQPHERRLGKGGVILFYGGGGHYNNRGGGGSSCNRYGWCHVNPSLSCRQSCSYGQCYTMNGATYQCNGSGRSFIGVLPAIFAMLFFLPWNEN